MPNTRSGVIADFPTPIFIPIDSYQHYTDAELLQRCIQRDEQAWQALLNRYGSFVYSVTTRFNLMADEIAYVFQSVFLALLDNLEELAHESNLSAWFTTVTLWHCRQYVESDDMDEMLTADEPSNLRRELQDLEEQRLIHQAVASTHESSRQVLFELLKELGNTTAHPPSSSADEIRLR